MHAVAIAWMFVVLLMALAEATERAEGLQPDAEAAVAEPAAMAITPSAGEGHRGGEATGSAIAPKRKEA